MENNRYYLWEDKRDVQVERRKSYRTTAKLDIEMDINGKISKGKTLDISSLGASCVIDKPLEEFSRVNTRIKLPIKDSKGKMTIEAPVIVVNIRKLSGTGEKYRLGFYFDDLSEKIPRKHEKHNKRPQKRAKRKEELAKQQQATRNRFQAFKKWITVYQFIGLSGK